MNFTLTITEEEITKRVAGETLKIVDAAVKALILEQVNHYDFVSYIRRTVKRELERIADEMISAEADKQRDRISEDLQGLLKKLLISE